jgi:hypothetical protein
MRTHAEVIRKRIAELEALPSMHPYDRAELVNLRASLDLMWEAQVSRDKASSAFFNAGTYREDYRHDS